MSDIVTDIKNKVAENHVYLPDILGTPWEYAMHLTHRTNLQITLYEKVISEIIKHYENK